MRVDIEEVFGMQARRNQINREDLEDIEFYENDKKLEISKEAIEEFAYIGLNNIDFIQGAFYKHEGELENEKDQ